MKQNRRKIPLINSSFQIKLIATFILLNAAIMSLFGIFLYLFTNSEIESQFFSAHISYKNMHQLLLPIIITLSVITVLIGSIVISVFVLFMSHRLAGPLYRFNAIVEEIEKRNLLPRTGIRKNDQFYECSVSITRMVATLAADFRLLKKHTDLIKKEAGKNAALKKHMDAIDQVIGQYKV